MDNETRYIFTKGELFQKDFSIVFDSEKGKLYLPIKNIRELYCFNEITLSSKLMQLFSKTRIVVHFFGYHENYIGSFYPKEYLLSGKLTVAQALYYTNSRLNIAKPIVKGITSNIYNVLYHYYRHGKEEIKKYLDWLRRDVDTTVDGTENIKQLLRIEGEIWARFYSTFKIILPEDFALAKRVKRPPDNPINALISFGNSILYTKTITELYHTHLNQTISFLHEPSEHRFSLSLDLSEVFKPILVYKTIFECVNNRKLTVSKHFDKKYNYALLNEEGRKIFIQSFDERYNQSFFHATLKRRVSYKQAIRLDGYKLIKQILENKKFKPFNLEDNK